jgi:hypothetical protein
MTSEQIKGLMESLPKHYTDFDLKVGAIIETLELPLNDGQRIYEVVRIARHKSGGDQNNIIITAVDQGSLKVESFSLSWVTRVIQPGQGVTSKPINLFALGYQRPECRGSNDVLVVKTKHSWTGTAWDLIREGLASLDRPIIGQIDSDKAEYLFRLSCPGILGTHRDKLNPFFGPLFTVKKRAFLRWISKNAVKVLTNKKDDWNAYKNDWDVDDFEDDFDFDYDRLFERRHEPLEWL